MSCNTVCLCAPYFKENPCLPPQPVEYVDDLRLENQNLKMEKEGKTIYLAGATLNVVCRPGYKLDGPSKITCSMGNWTSAPTCSGNVKQDFSCGVLSNESEIILNWSLNSSNRQ